MHGRNVKIHYSCLECYCEMSFFKHADYDYDYIL
jgi:hypothetical protein